MHIQVRSKTSYPTKALWSRDNSTFLQACTAILVKIIDPIYIVSYRNKRFIIKGDQGNTFFPFLSLLFLITCSV